MSVDTRNSTVTIDTDEWVYYDMYGVPHTVTNGQTFVLTSVDDSVTGYCRYYILPVAVATGITTTDGLTIKFAPGETSASNGFAESTELQSTSATPHPTFDWTIPIKCPVSGVIQYWKVTSITMSNLDFDSAGTMAISMKDQFDNEMVLTGITVGTAA